MTINCQLNLFVDEQTGPKYGKINFILELNIFIFRVGKKNFTSMLKFLFLNRQNLQLNETDEHRKTVKK